MIIRVAGAAPDTVDTARQNLEEMTRGWEHALTAVTSDAPTPPDARGDPGKVVDPIAVTALILSVPSAALAVVDLTDRIGKRRRAKQLIDHAHELAAQQITLEIIARNSPRNLATLDADQLLDLLAEEQGNDPS